jgi:hypothetical protein
MNKFQTSYRNKAGDKWTSCLVPVYMNADVCFDVYLIALEQA